MRRSAKPDSDGPATTALQQAVRLLARREHGRRELARKLAGRGFAADEIEPALDQLESRGLLDEQRFAEQFARSRLERGQGPIKIRAELEQRGCSAAASETALAALEADWAALAATVRARRFGATIPAEYRERARHARFLESRGFTAEQILSALRRGD